jgi:hypothetical protein
MTHEPSATASAPLNPTGWNRLICCFCRKSYGEVEHMLIIAGRKGHGILAVCDQCSNDTEEKPR